MNLNAVFEPAQAPDDSAIANNLQRLRQELIKAHGFRLDRTEGRLVRAYDEGVRIHVRTTFTHGEGVVAIHKRKGHGLDERGRERHVLVHSDDFDDAYRLILKIVRKLTAVKP